VAHRDTIELGLSRGRNAMAIWQDLVDTCGFAAGYQSVRRFVRKLEENSSPQARVVILMAPGEQAQVDFGEGPMVREPHSGKCRRTRLFVLTLGAAANPSACWCSDPVHRSGPSYTRRRSAVLEASPGSSCWTILREGVLAPDIYVSRQVRTGSCPECGSYGRFEVITNGRI
jgi:hypothetical protein